MRLTNRIRRESLHLRAAMAVLAGLLATGCATRRPESIVPQAPIARDIVWRVEEGDLLRVRVFGHPDLDAEPIVGANGTALLPGLGRVPVAGLTSDSLEGLLNARYAEKVVRGAAVQVTMQREITLYGAARAPGVYAAPPGMSILSFMARYGGTQAQGEMPDVFLETADGRRLALPKEARLGTIEIHRSDALIVAESSWFVRNQNAITATSLVISMVTTILTLGFAVSR
jgi:protein involved in polysaccharide export with SLBB domain